MDKSFYGHKRQTNNVIAAQREGIPAPTASSSLFFQSVFYHPPVPGIVTPRTLLTASQGLQGSQQTSKAFT